jgi:DNA-binding NarL/FixJ family response regulator
MPSPCFKTVSPVGRTLLKERVAQPGQLAEAVRAVAAGGSVIDPRIVEAMLTAGNRPDVGPLRHLRWDEGRSFT